MLYYEISVPDRNDATMRVSLDGKYYYLRTTWNEYGGFWLLSIYDAEMNIIIGVKNEDFEPAIQAIYNIFVMTRL